MKKKKGKNNKATLIAIAIVAVVIIAIVAFVLFSNRGGEKTYEVGKDIKAGEYVIVGVGTYRIHEKKDKKYGYFEICTNKECGNANRVVNDNVIGKAYVVLEKGQYLHTKDMKLYEVDKYKTSIKDSISYDSNYSLTSYYKVGKDLSAGSYTITGDQYYYSVCSKPTCNILKDEIISSDFNETANKSASFKLEKGQYLIVSGTKPITITKK